MSYSQLSPDERINFQIFKAAGEAVKDIALKMGRHFSTLYRELRRNHLPGGTYQAVAAIQLAQCRSEIPRSPTKCTPENELWLEGLLCCKDNGLTSAITLLTDPPLRNRNFTVCGH